MNNYPTDTLRDSFLKFLGEGMNYDEALSQFDEDEFKDAAMAELDSGETRRVDFNLKLLDVGSFVVERGNEFLPALFELLVRAKMERRNSVHGADYQQALALWQAGWTSESQRPDSQVMSWYWRAPSKRPGKPGRRFLSTNQAFNALQKSSLPSPQTPA